MHDFGSAIAGCRGLKQQEFVPRNEEAQVEQSRVRVEYPGRQESWTNEKGPIDNLGLVP